MFQFVGRCGLIWDIRHLRQRLPGYVRRWICSLADGYRLLSSFLIDAQVLRPCILGALVLQAEAALKSVNDAARGILKELSRLSGHVSDREFSLKTISLFLRMPLYRLLQSFQE